MSTDISNSHDDDVIDLRDLFVALLQNWPIILISILLSVLAAVFYLRSTPPVYSVDALLQVKTDSGDSDPVWSELGGVTAASPVETEVEIIRSRLILSKAAKKQNLDTRLTVKKASAAQKSLGTTQVLNSSKGVFVLNNNEVGLAISQFKTSNSFFDVNFRLTVTNQENYKLEQLQNEAVVAEYNGKNKQPLIVDNEFGELKLLVNYDPSMVGSELSLSKLGVRNTVQRIAKSLSTTEKGGKTGILSLTYQGKNKEQIRDTLNTVLDVYMADNVARMGAQKQRTLQFLESQLPQLKSNLEAVEKKFNNFRRVNNTVDITKESELLLEQSIQFQTKKNELEQRKAELSSRFTSDYPVIAQIDSQLTALNKKVREIESRLKVLPNVQREYFQLFRDVEVNEKLYTNLLDNYQKLKVANAGEIGNVRIIDRAVLPIQRIKPKPNLILLMSLIAGTLIGAALAFLRSVLNSGIRDSNKLQSNIDVPILANVPHSKQQNKISGKKNQNKVLSMTAPNDVSVESLKSLRTTLHLSLQSAKNNIVLLTGVSPDVGNSFISTNLATVMAQSGKRVILIDGDMRQGHLHEYFGVEANNGLSDYLTGDIESVADVIQPTLTTGLDLIVRGTVPANPSELIMQQRFNDVLKRLSVHYDLVLIDSSPILAVTDSAIIGQQAGSTLVVVRYDVSNTKEMQTTITKLQQNGANVSGVVFNDLKKQVGSGQNYQFGYKYDSRK